MIYMVFKEHMSFFREKDAWEEQAFTEEQKQVFKEDGEAMWAGIILGTEADLWRSDGDVPSVYMLLF